MPPHGKPDDAFAFRKAHEIHALDANFDLRNVPPRAQDRLLLACWNIANLACKTTATTRSMSWPMSVCALI